MKIKRTIRRIISDINFLYRYLNSLNRKLPDFLIIGAQKSGTTSLYSFLAQHPNITPALKKEVHYFDLNYNRKIKWYRSFFPKTKSTNDQLLNLTGEASPQYIFHPHSLYRIKKTLPNVKIIVLLRNPVNRTYSHYQHQVRVGREKLSFEDALEMEIGRTEDEYNKMLDNNQYNSHNYLMYSYKARSNYYPQIKKCLSIFDKKNVLIIQAEKFDLEPENQFARVLNFLGLPNYEINFSKRFNVHKYPPINEKTKNDLESFFRPYNEKLFDLIGEKFDW